MSNYAVSLDCRNFPSDGNDGYRDVTASNNATYSYRYSGGTDGNGNVTETANAGAGIITVTINADPRYTVNHVDISGDIENQLGSTVNNPPTSAVITDSDTSTGSGYYTVVVNDTRASCTFPCDPRISHV
ncbi:MAG TPA: hypothetical protein PK743_07930 [Luteimonas sp.]|nr:hypothetical protein [Luteimonas sp.]HRP72542.1 hypothetical protein [Luteimonas sp.]